MLEIFYIVINLVTIVLGIMTWQRWKNDWTLRSMAVIVILLGLWGLYRIDFQRMGQPITERDWWSLVAFVVVLIVGGAVLYLRRKHADRGV